MHAFAIRPSTSTSSGSSIHIAHPNTPGPQLRSDLGRAAASAKGSIKAESTSRPNTASPWPARLMMRSNPLPKLGPVEVTPASSQASHPPPKCRVWSVASWTPKPHWYVECRIRKALVDITTLPMDSRQTVVFPSDLLAIGNTGHRTEGPWLAPRARITTTDCCVIVGERTRSLFDRSGNKAAPIGGGTPRPCGSPAAQEA